MEVRKIRREKKDNKTNYIINNNSGFPSADFLPNKLKKNNNIIIISNEDNTTTGQIQKDYNI